MNNINDLQIGKVGEYLVCADLIMKGYIAFPSEQGLSFDVVLVSNNKLYKLQVKTTRGVQPVPQRKTRTDKYLFHIRRCGKHGRRSYLDSEVDIFAIVALDTKAIGYLRADKTKQTMFFIPDNATPSPRTLAKKITDYKLEDCL
jgi:hypothetical protein